MEYPMISFNGSRPEKDEELDEITYARKVKAFLITVVIHEVGHNYFPMLVNSDERQWAWLDEGINTFLHTTALQMWEENFPVTFSDDTTNNPTEAVAGYMRSENIVPLMTQSDSLPNYFANSYLKPAAALTVLRETVMGRELFDHALKTYATRWQFKRPTPSDFFRSMEDASGMDLDWFWQGWFFGTDHVDIGIAGVSEYKISTEDPDVEFPLRQQKYHEDNPELLTVQRNRQGGVETRLSQFPELADFYTENDQFTVSNADRNKYAEFLDGLKDWEREVLDRAIEDDEYVYFVGFKNIGGLVSPLPLTLHYADGGTESRMIPAEIWRVNADQVTKLFILEKKLSSISLDDMRLTGDVNRDNNHFPPKFTSSRISLHKPKDTTRNLMLDMLQELQAEGESGSDDQTRAVPLTTDTQ